MFGFQLLFTDPCPELTEGHQQAMKGFDCADNEIDLKADFEGAPLIPSEAFSLSRHDRVLASWRSGIES